MNAITTIRPATTGRTSAPVMASFKPYAFKGKGKDARSTAFLSIAPHSYSENVRRGDTVAALHTALGNKPDDAVLLAARNEWMCGRMAFRLPAGEFPREVSETIQKLDYCRSLITHYAKAPKDGAPKYALKKGLIGYRSVTQQKVMNAAVEAWSQLLAELGLNKAQSQSQRDANKRAPAMAGSTARGKAKGATPPNASQLVQAPAPLTADAAVAHLVAQATALMQFAKKNAKLVPTDFATLCNAFHRDVTKADGERRLAAK